MKLFLDVASKYLMEQYNLYKRRANILLILSLLCWSLTLLLGYFTWVFGILRLLFVVLILSCISIVLSIITNDMYARSGVYSRIHEDLERIRYLANREAEKTSDSSNT